MHQMTSENDQRDRQDENWSIPTNMEGRNDTRQEPQGIPPAPSPSEGRFTDWSSLGSPHVRTSPHGTPNREIEQSANQPDQWATQSGSVPTREEAARDHSQEEVIIPPRICQQPDEQSAQMIDMGTNILNIEARSQRDGIRTALESNVQATRPLVDVILPTGMNKQIQFPNINLSISGYDSETLRGSHARPQEPGMQENSAIPQLDGPSTIPSRNQGGMSENIRIGQDYPHDGTYLQGTSTSNRREYLGDSSDDNRSYRGQRYPNQRGRLPDEGRYPNRDRRPPRRGRSQDDGRPPMDMEDPLMEEDPLMVEDPQ